MHGARRCLLLHRYQSRCTTRLARFAGLLELCFDDASMSSRTLKEKDAVGGG